MPSSGNQEKHRRMNGSCQMAVVNSSADMLPQLLRSSKISIISRKPITSSMTIVLVVLLLTVVSKTGSNVTNICETCVCSKRDDGDTVDCSNFNLIAATPLGIPPKTQILNLNNVKLKMIPEQMENIYSLKKLIISNNEIQEISTNSFTSMPNLHLIDMSANPVENVTIQKLPKLKQLILSKAYKLRRFPNLSGTFSLEYLKLDRGRLNTVPYDFCGRVPKLKTLNLQTNRISSIPRLKECSELILLDLTYNHIEELRDNPFLHQTKLIYLFLGYNLITSIALDSFFGLKSLHVLDMSNNRIKYIHPEAFLPVKELRDLNLGNNSFPTLPSRGLQNIRQLKTFNNPNLKDFPPPSAFPLVHNLALSYSYHCCAYLQLVNQFPSYPSSIQENVVWIKDEIDPSLWISNTSTLWPAFVNFSGKLSNQFWKNFAKEYTDHAMQYAEEYYQDYKSAYNLDEMHHYSLQCVPAPGPFLPCEDLFGWWTLRCGVWVVFLLAMLGNGIVVTVLLFGRSRVDVPRFLVCNLAVADFFMGIYLGILAVVDASTLGMFKVHGILWQTSIGCQLAGFLGVFSSELSVYTLSVITLERKYAITNAMHLNKRLSLRHAGYIMIGGWIFALTMAVLPLLGVSDYRRFAICLPFAVETVISVCYVVFLILVNGVAFVILMACYLKMYCSIRGSQAWNSNEYRIAKRMALLVFTDFLCWAPIAFFSLTAVSGIHLVSLEEAKVFAIFILPLNSCANPFLYAIFTKQFKKDCVWICKRIEESRVTRGIGRCQHSSNFSNHQTAVNTNSLVDNPNKKTNTESKNWKLWAKRWFLCREEDEQITSDDYTLTIAQIQKSVQCRHKHTSSISSENFSSRSDSWKQGAMSLRSLDRHGYQGSRKLLRRHSGDSNTSSIRQDSSTSTFRLSRSSVSSDNQNPYRHVGHEGKDRPTADRGKLSDQEQSPPLQTTHARRKLCRQVAVDDSVLPNTFEPKCVQAEMGKVRTIEQEVLQMVTCMNEQIERGEESPPRTDGVNREKNRKKAA